MPASMGQGGRLSPPLTTAGNPRSDQRLASSFSHPNGVAFFTCPLSVAPQFAHSGARKDHLSFDTLIFFILHVVAFTGEDGGGAKVSKANANAIESDLHLHYYASQLRLMPR